MTTELAKNNGAKPSGAMALTARGVEVNTTTEMYQLATKIISGGIPLPQNIKGPQDLVGVLLFAHERGLPPIFAAQNIANINGKLTMYGDAIVGLVRASGKAKMIEERTEGDGDTMVAVCRVERKDIGGVTEVRFSVSDAKAAKLWGKAGPWQMYPRRMLQMRARGFAMRDAFADVLGGIITREEAEDYPTRRDHVDTSEEAQVQILARLDEPADVVDVSPAPATQDDPPADEFFTTAD